MSDSNVLKYAIENGIIDMAYVQEQIEMKKRNAILSKHPYEIFLGSDNFWHTYIPDSTKKNNRRAVKKKNRKDIEDCVIAYLEEIEEFEIKQKMTLIQLFPEWIKYKEKHTKSTSYMKRITADWNKYYAKNKELISKPVNEFTKIELDTWVHEMIKQYDMTKNQYYNMSVIIRQIFDYAVEIGILERNIFSDVKVSTKLFKKVKKKDSITQVYLTDEIPQMIKEMLRRFYNDPSDTAPLAVLLDFEIGVRIGELVAIKTTDFSPDMSYVHIQRQSVRQFDYIDDTCTKMKFREFEVVEYTKSDDGDRNIYLTTVARKIISVILAVNEKYGYQCDDYLFVKNNKQISHYAVQARVLRGCQTIGILTKSMHKIRKTYISSLIDSGLNIDEIRRQVGHSDERTTYKNYCFNRLTTTETERKMENALNFDNSYDILESGVIKSYQNSKVLIG